MGDSRVEHALAERPAICVDIDNVLAQTDVVMRDLIRQYTGGRVNLSYEDVREFDYWKCPDCNGGQITKEQWDEVHDQFSTPEVVRRLIPIAGARAQLNALRSAYLVHLVSSRKPSVHEATGQWLATHAIPFDELIFASHGRKHELPTKYVLVIEDHYDQAKSFAEIGVKAVLLDHPWNRGKGTHTHLAWAVSWDHIRTIAL